MGSLFESTVYQARRAIEWAEIDLDYFMKDLAQNSEPTAGCSLSVHSRPSVRTRFWWTFSWTGADGEAHCMEGETMQLCLWRAAVREKQLREKLERKGSETGI